MPRKDKLGSYRANRGTTGLGCSRFLYLLLQEFEASQALLCSASAKEEEKKTPAPQEEDEFILAWMLSMDRLEQFSNWQYGMHGNGVSLDLV